MAVLRAYAWIMSLGADGLKMAAETAVLNNNYLMTKMAAIRGLSIPYAPGKHRIDQFKASWENLHAETGLRTDDGGHRLGGVDVGYQDAHRAQPTTSSSAESTALVSTSSS